MFFRKKYINREVEKEIKEKGFTVYNYVSLKELFLTVQRDYLAILTEINKYFGITVLVLGVVSYISSAYLLFFVFIFLVYALIFIYLFFKLVLRTFYYLKITDVVYTEKGVILGNELYKYDDEQNLVSQLEEYEEMFDEFLSKPSKISKVILKRKEKLFQENLELGKSSVELVGKMDSEAGFFILILNLFYNGSLYFFYYFGYFFGIVIFFIVNIFLELILKFTKNTEVKIKGKLEDIDDSFANMEKIDQILGRKIDNFRDGEIKNISIMVEKNFSNFYTEVLSIVKQKKILFILINNSKFKNFVNFEKLEKYLKKNFNKPIEKMVGMLIKFEKLLEKQIEILRITKSNSKTADLTLDKKETQLIHQLKILKLNKNKLEKII